MKAMKAMKTSLDETGYVLNSPETPDGFMVMTLPGNDDTTIAVHNLSEGFDLLFNQVNTSRLPAVIPPLGHTILLLNYCMEGRCEMNLNTGFHLFMEPGHISFGPQYGVGEFHYSTGVYRGFELMMDLTLFEQSPVSLFEETGIHPAQIVERLSACDKVFVAQANDELQRIAERIWNLRNTTQTGEMKLRCAQLLTELSAIPPRAERHVHYFTSVQTEIARKAAQMIRDNLSEGITVEVMANELGVGRTSLKELFKGVHGMGVSEYRRRERMTRAAQLLEGNPAIKISQVAEEVGYENQAKFAAAFRKWSGFAPLEYRRRQSLRG